MSSELGAIKSIEGNRGLQNSLRNKYSKRMVIRPNTPYFFNPEKESGRIKAANQVRRNTIIWYLLVLLLSIILLLFYSLYFGNVW